MLRYIIIFLAGALGAFEANRGIAVFNDAVRPIVPEYREGRMSHAEFAAITFGLSFGLVIGFGIPYSLMYTIILVHCLWLGTDIIGIAFPGKPIDDWYKDKESLRGAILSAICGGLYGVLLLAGLQAVVNAASALPVNIFDAWQNISGPVMYAFIAFPCVVITKDYGWKNGLLSLIVVVLVRSIFNKFYPSLADGITLLAGLLMVMFFAMKDKTPSSGDLSSIFGDRIKNIQKNIGWIAAMGAIYGIACNIGLLMEGPASLVAVGEGNISGAVPITIARALSFIPLKGLTSITTGTFVTDGLGFTATVGLLAPNAFVAGILGAVVMAAEAYSLVLIAKVFDKFPGFKKSGDSMRVAMSRLLEIALLVGSMYAAEGMAPGYGYLVVAGLFAMNEYFKKPITRLAVGPIAMILVGVLVNILALVGLFTVAA